MTGDEAQCDSDHAKQIRLRVIQLEAQLRESTDELTRAKQKQQELEDLLRSYGDGDLATYVHSLVPIQDHELVVQDADVKTLPCKHDCEQTALVSVFC